jgi:signal transduction histidine kinase
MTSSCSTVICRWCTGTGLGLSIVASVAKAHGGHAEARARPHGGLDVQITLPATSNGHRSAFAADQDHATEG